MLLPGAVQVYVTRMNDGHPAVESDLLAAEEPLEIRLGYVDSGKRLVRTISITMRTPGDDFALAAGFLFSEGIIQAKTQIASIRHCVQPAADTGSCNVVRVDLAAGIPVDLNRLERHFYTSSSCGVCGKTSLSAVSAAGSPEPIEDALKVTPEVIQNLPGALRSEQAVFEQTGGLHASALFTRSGELTALREDVGRHNALDKLIGTALIADNLPLSNVILLVSGRSSFELVQKAAMARIPILAAVGAPSSLAVELAKQYNITLLGFLRDSRFNIYSGAERIYSAKL